MTVSNFCPSMMRPMPFSGYPFQGRILLFFGFFNYTKFMCPVSLRNVNFSRYSYEDKIDIAMHICRPDELGIMPSSSALIPMSICKSQSSLFNRSFTTYE
jgi:hypothetical protein